MRYLALDFETGNASPLSACALGASVFEDNQLVDEKISLIRPPECVGRFHWGNVRVNHIKEKMVADAPSFAEVWEPLADIAEGSVIVCHNAMFDTNVLCSCLAHYGLKMPECRYLCTVKVSKRVWPELENHKLDTVSAALNIDLLIFSIRFCFQPDSHSISPRSSDHCRKCLSFMIPHTR